MQVSTFSESARRNMFIQYANSFMSNPTQEPDEIVENTQKANPQTEIKSKGIETLTTFSIFPKQVVSGHTIYTA